MKDQFYIVLPSNSSMHYFKENTTTHFITQLPQQIRLQGSWLVALTEIQIPLTFQHVSSEQEDRTIALKHISRDFLEINKLDARNSTDANAADVYVFDPLSTNRLRADNFTSTVSLLRPGIYKDVYTIVHEINNLKCIKNHLEFRVERGGYVTVTRLCAKTTCSQFHHQLCLSKKLQKILGFERMKILFIEGDQEVVEGDRPAHLSNGLPNMLMIYSDICEPYVTGDVQSRLLRAVSLNIDDYTYGSTRIKSFSPPMYLPLLYTSFQTIEIDIRDQNGEPIPFDYGTLTVTLHFKRTE